MAASDGGGVMGWRRVVPSMAGVLAALVGGAATTPVSGADLGSAGMVVSEILGVRPLVSEPDADRRQTSQWGWPLIGEPEIARGFDPPERRWQAGHRGIDLVGVAGEDVLAVDDGVVSYSGVIAGVGIVSITHPSGLLSTYQPVSDRAARGDRVGRGDQIGRLDAGGHCRARDCLHLGARRGRDHYVDPTPLLLGVELTLLPVGS